MNSNIRILVIEDSIDQIEWAKQELGENIEIAVNTEDAISILETKEFDYILSDLELPNTPADAPSAENGKKLLEEKLLPLLAEKKIKGLAVVSNFEHHQAQNQDRAMEQSMNCIARDLKKMSSHDISWKFKTPGFHAIPRGAEKIENFIVVMDLHLHSYDNYQFQGKILSHEKFISLSNNYRENYGSHGPHIDYIIGLMKPWGRVLDVLKGNS